VLDWRPLYAEPNANAPDMATRFISALRDSTADQVLSCWVQLRTVEIVLDEWASEFGGIDPLKPAFRDELNEAKQDLATLQEHLRWLQIDVALRDPRQAEIDEMTQWIKSRIA
jgi:hypothetical protein